MGKRDEEWISPNGSGSLFAKVLNEQLKEMGMDHDWQAVIRSTAEKPRIIKIVKRRKNGNN